MSILAGALALVSIFRSISAVNVFPGIRDIWLWSPWPLATSAQDVWVLFWPWPAASYRLTPRPCCSSILWILKHLKSRNLHPPPTPQKYGHFFCFQCLSFLCFISVSLVSTRVSQSKHLIWFLPWSWQDSSIEFMYVKPCSLSAWSISSVLEGIMLLHVRQKLMVEWLSIIF